MTIHDVAPAPDGMTVGELLTEIEIAGHAQDYREATVGRLSSAVRLGALNAYCATLASILNEASMQSLRTPAATPHLQAGIAAAMDEAGRLLEAIGAPLPEIREHVGGHDV